MEENVALDSKNKKIFLKSIRGIKKLIKKNEVKSEAPKRDEADKLVKPEIPKKDEVVKPVKPFSMKLKDGKINKKKRKRRERGLVYLSHIPHGFYEHQMTQYFKQFGVVTNVRVIRSKRTGNSKGFAFVEFKEPAVGQIVAETMNNYLMGKRLIKAAYIPPEKQKLAFRKNWNTVYNPGSQSRLKMKKAFNADKDENGELKKAKKLLSNWTKSKKRLNELGINYDFFKPVDIPEVLLNQIVKQEKVDDDKNTIKEESKPKKNKQENIEDKKVDKNEKVQNQKQQIVEGKKGKKNKKNVKENIVEVDKKVPVVETKKQNVLKANTKEKVPDKVNEKQQKQKEQKLKDAGVKPAVEFIKIGEDSDGESDSSYDFDSDEYEKMMEEENGSDVSSGESDDDSGDESSEASEESDEEVPQKKLKKEKPQVEQPVHLKKQAKKQQAPKPQVKKQEQKKPPAERKRKVQKPAVSPPKPKFEKQSQKTMKKQFKKK